VTARLSGQRRVAEVLAENTVAVNGITLQAGQLLLPNGAVGAPAIAFATATSTGFYFTGSFVHGVFGGSSRINYGASAVGLAVELNMGASAIRFIERADPAAPAADNMFVYAKDSGAAKTQLAARFATGAVQVPAVEP
jgi:hypothetical protein